MTATANFKEILTSELEDLRKRIIANHRKAGQVASGKTQKSFRVDIGDKEGSLSSRKYIQVLETGRKGGRVPFRFRDIIYQWSLDKGIKMSDSQRKTFSYFVAKKIQESGTVLFRKGGRRDIFSNEIEKTLEHITGKIADRIVLDITTILKQEKAEAL